MEEQSVRSEVDGKIEDGERWLIMSGHPAGQIDDWWQVWADDREQAFMAQDWMCDQIDEYYYDGWGSWVWGPRIIADPSDEMIAGVTKWPEEKESLYNYCPRCGCSWAVHDGDGGCVDEEIP